MTNGVESKDVRVRERRNWLMESWGFWTHISYGYEVEIMVLVNMTSSPGMSTSASS